MENFERITTIIVNILAIFTPIYYFLCPKKKEVANNFNIDNSINNTTYNTKVENHNNTHVTYKNNHKVHSNSDDDLLLRLIVGFIGGVLLFGLYFQFYRIITTVYLILFSILCFISSKELSSQPQEQKVQWTIRMFGILFLLMSTFYTPTSIGLIIENIPSLTVSSFNDTLTWFADTTKLFFDVQTNNPYLILYFIGRILGVTLIGCWIFCKLFFRKKSPIINNKISYWKLFLYFAFFFLALHLNFLFPTFENALNNITEWFST